MKRTGAILLVAGLAFVVTIPASVAGAKGYKPPKSSCWQLDGTGFPLDGFFLAIALKSSGMKFKDMNRSVKFYSIQGAMAPVLAFRPVDGSGYLDAVANEFEGSIDGRQYLVGFVTCNLYLSDGRSEIFCAVAPNLDTADEYQLNPIECDTLILD